MFTSPEDITSLNKWLGSQITPSCCCTSDIWAHTSPDRAHDERENKEDDEEEEEDENRKKDDLDEEKRRFNKV